MTPPYPSLYDAMQAQLDALEPDHAGDDAPELTQGVLPLEQDEIPLQDAIETCHRIAEKMRMYE